MKIKTKDMMNLLTVPREPGKSVVTDHFLLVTHRPLAAEPFKKLTVQRCFLFLWSTQPQITWDENSGGIIDSSVINLCHIDIYRQPKNDSRDSV